MAAGDRRVKIQEIRIASANPVPFHADWQLFIEDRLGADRFAFGGRTTGSFGTLAQFNAKTGSQLKTDVRNAVLADASVPANDDVS